MQDVENCFWNKEIDICALGLSFIHIDNIARLQTLTAMPGDL